MEESIFLWWTNPTRKCPLLMVECYLLESIGFGIYKIQTSAKDVTKFWEPFFITFLRIYTVLEKFGCSPPTLIEVALVTPLSAQCQKEV